MGEIKAVITQEAARLSCNFGQVEAAIRGTLEEYRGAVFTEESKPLAKKIVAGLRAQKKTFEENLKEEKKKYMQPWEAFEAEAKRLIAMYEEPIDLINGQVKAFEEERIRRKKELIQKAYQEEVPGELLEYLPLERVYNPRWENATVKEKEIRKELVALAGQVGTDIETIRGMESDCIQAALSLYLEHFRLSEAVSYINRYEQQKAEILQREQEKKRAGEEQRLKREAEEKVLAEQRAEAEQMAAVEQARAEAAQAAIDCLIPEAEGETDLYEYRMALSADGKEKLELYLNSVGIEWEEIV